MTAEQFARTLLTGMARYAHYYTDDELVLFYSATLNALAEASAFHSHDRGRSEWGAEISAENDNEELAPSGRQLDEDEQTLANDVSAAIVALLALRDDSEDAEIVRALRTF